MMPACQRTDVDETLGGRISLPIKVADVARPFSQRRRLQKRNLQSIESVGIASPPRVKKLRLAGEALANSLEVCPKLTSGVVSDGRFPSKPDQSRQEEDDKNRLEVLVNAAIKMFEDIWASFVIRRRWHGEVRARALTGLQVSERYEEARALLVALLPWTNGEMEKESAGSRCYTVVQFQGCATSKGTPQSLLKDWDAMLEWKLRQLRDESARGRALDAFCALLAVLSSRPEMCWLDWQDADVELKGRLKESLDKEATLRDFVAESLSKKVRGYIAKALVEPTSVFRVAFAKDAFHFQPASLIVTNQLPLKEAFEKMDSEGPFKNVSCQWFRKASRQFALQDICKGVAPGDRNERISVKSLTAEPRLKELLGSKKTVVLLDAFAALAPRKLATENGLSKIVQSELMALLRQAKARGQAVVFMLGGDKPQILAEKVYLRPPFTDHDLRCGYIRWRESPRLPWAREKQAWEDRVCIGLQLP